LKLLKLALEKQDYNLAAHILVYGLIKAKINQVNNKQQEVNSNSRTTQKRRTQR